MKKFIAISALMFVLLGCDRADIEKMQQDSTRYGLPTGATNIQAIGNGWLYFDLDGRTYIYHRSNDKEAISEVSQR